MKKKGHIGFGSLFLLPIILDKSIPYIITTDKYLIQINNIIYTLNEHFILLNYLIFNPFHNILKLIILLTLFYFGIRFPDLDLIIKKFSNHLKNHRYLYHRQLTHSIFLSLFILFYFYKNIFIFYFIYGMITHLIADIITGSVPIFLTGKYYKTFNIFQWRLGIDNIYMLLKPKYKKGNTKLQIIINKVKDKIVEIFEKISSILIIIVFFTYLYKIIF